MTPVARMSNIRSIARCCWTGVWTADPIRRLTQILCRDEYFTYSRLQRHFKNCCEFKRCFNNGCRLQCRLYYLCEILTWMIACWMFELYSSRSTDRLSVGHPDSTGNDSVQLTCTGWFVSIMREASLFLGVSICSNRSAHELVHSWSSSSAPLSYHHPASRYFFLRIVFFHKNFHGFIFVCRSLQNNSPTDQNSCHTAFNFEIQGHLHSFEMLWYVSLHPKVIILCWFAIFKISSYVLQEKWRVSFSGQFTGTADKLHRNHWVPLMQLMIGAYVPQWW